MCICHAWSFKGDCLCARLVSCLVIVTPRSADGFAWLRMAAGHRPRRPIREEAQRARAQWLTQTGHKVPHTWPARAQKASGHPQIGLMSISRGPMRRCAQVRVHRESARSFFSVRVIVALRRQEVTYLSGNACPADHSRHWRQRHAPRRNSYLHACLTPATLLSLAIEYIQSARLP
jgi:hypothetical protein